jgi:hypothetical protein
MEVERIQIVNAVVSIIASKYDEVILPDRASMKGSLTRDDCASSFNPLPESGRSVSAPFVTRFFSAKI